MANDTRFDKQIQRLGEMVERLESTADPNLRAMAKEFLESLMALHGEALERMLEITSGEGESGKAIIKKYGNDELVSCLFLLYGLHPEDIHARVTRALQNTHEYLESHGARAELVSVHEDGSVTLHLEMKSTGCGSSAAQVKALLEAAVQNAAPDASSIVVQETGSLQVGFVSVAQLENSNALGGVSIGGVHGHGR